MVSVQATASADPHGQGSLARPSSASPACVSSRWWQHTGISCCCRRVSPARAHCSDAGCADDHGGASSARNCDAIVAMLGVTASAGRELVCSSGCRGGFIERRSQAKKRKENESGKDAMT
eukprot:747795-Hanusia_phi.AAC.2